MDNYKTKGYSDQFEKTYGKKKIPYLSSFDIDSYIEGLSGNRIEGGIIQSKDGKLKIDLNEGTITYDDGITKTTIV